MVEFGRIRERADEVCAGAVPVAPIPRPHVRRLLSDLATQRVLGCNSTKKLLSSVLAGKSASLEILPEIVSGNVFNSS